MHITYQKHPMDLIIILLCTLVLIPVILLNLNQTLQIIIGLPFLLFFPGYCLIFTLFPEQKASTGIDLIERIALSFGLSIAIVPLIGLALNYTSWGIQLQPILFSIVLFIFGISTLGMYRWYQLPVDRRYLLDIQLSFPKSETRLDKILTVILCISILLALSTLTYVIVTPKEGEQFTELYLLGPNGIADQYPQNFSSTDPINLIIGVVNHEYKTVNYTLEIWLINQTKSTNPETNETNTTYHHAWNIDRYTMTLSHVPIDIEGNWEPQWQYNWTKTINKKGEYKLAFLLYTTPQNVLDPAEDNVDIIKEKSDTAYRSVHLFITSN